MKNKLFKKKEFYLSISEGQLGLETYISEDMHYLNYANKKLIKAFLEGVLEDLENTNVSDQARRR